jgi:hypothetical protein
VFVVFFIIVYEQGGTRLEAEEDDKKTGFLDETRFPLFRSYPHNMRMTRYSTSSFIPNSVTDLRL